MSDLKPCPFCGGEAREEEAGDGGKFIECSTCSACTALHYDRAENLVYAWNRRWDAEDTLREMREALRDCIEALGNSHPGADDYWRACDRAEDALAKAEDALCE